MGSIFVVAFYRGGNAFLTLVLLVITRWRVSGRDNLPRYGAFVLASNHMSMADPPLIACAARHRRIRYMAKSEIFKLPFGVVPRLYGAFPVRRFGADAAALLRGERILRDGGVVGMFPEGTRGRGQAIRPMQHGAALLALRTGAPIIPTAIAGTQVLANPFTLLKRPRIQIAFGEPIPVEYKEAPEREDLESLTNQVHAAVVCLYEEMTGSSMPTTAASGPAS